MGTKKNDDEEIKASLSDIDFEEKMKELEAISIELNSSKMPLSDSLSKFEKGVELYKSCLDFLSKAEKKVAELNESLEEKKFD